MNINFTPTCTNGRYALQEITPEQRRLLNDMGKPAYPKKDITKPLDTRDCLLRIAAHKTLSNQKSNKYDEGIMAYMPSESVIAAVSRVRGYKRKLLTIRQQYKLNKGDTQQISCHVYRDSLGSIGPIDGVIALDATTLSAISIPNSVGLSSSDNSSGNGILWSQSTNIDENLGMDSVIPVARASANEWPAERHQRLSYSVGSTRRKLFQDDTSNEAAISTAQSPRLKDSEPVSLITITSADKQPVQGINESDYSASSSPSTYHNDDEMNTTNSSPTSSLNNSMIGMHDEPYTPCKLSVYILPQTLMTDDESPSSNGPSVTGLSTPLNTYTEDIMEHSRSRTAHPIGYRRPPAQNESYISEDQAKCCQHEDETSTDSSSDILEVRKTQESHRKNIEFSLKSILVPIVCCLEPTTTKYTSSADIPTGRGIYGTSLSPIYTDENGYLVEALTSLKSHTNSGSASLDIWKNTIHTFINSAYPLSRLSAQITKDTANYTNDNLPENTRATSKVKVNLTGFVQQILGSRTDMQSFRNKPTQLPSVGDPPIPSTELPLMSVVCETEEAGRKDAGEAIKIPMTGFLKRLKWWRSE